MTDFKYKAGSIVLMETGEYSDFGYEGYLVTLCDLDLCEAIKTYKDQYKPKDKYDTPEPSGFVGWLCSTRQCAPLDCNTVHIGSYGELELIT